MKISLKITLSALVLFFGFSAFYFFILRQPASAISTNYNKSANTEITTSEWNTLEDDFLAKSGGTMAGNINMGNNSITGLLLPSVSDLSSMATVGYVNTYSSFAARDRDGNPLNIVCGATSIVTPDWFVYSADGIYIKIYTTKDGTKTGPANFSSQPIYITSILGTNVEYLTGLNTVYYPKSTWDDYAVGDEFRYFRVYVKTSVTAAQAEARKWYVNWCGIGS